MMRTWTVACIAAVLLAAAIGWVRRPPALVASTAPEEVATTAGATAAASSCKPSVPLAVAMHPTGKDRWQLEIQSLDQDRDVVVWMWSASEAERREVWRGRLHPGTPRRLDVAFAATIPGAPVLAAVEAVGPSGETMRTLVAVDPSGRALQSLATAAGQLVRDPDTGELIQQYEGQPSTAGSGR